jgi:hypothetical protein
VFISVFTLRENTGWPSGQIILYNFNITDLDLFRDCSPEMSHTTHEHICFSVRYRACACLFKIPITGFEHFCVFTPEMNYFCLSLTSAIHILQLNPCHIKKKHFWRNRHQGYWLCNNNLLICFEPIIGIINSPVIACCMRYSGCLRRGPVYPAGLETLNLDAL